MVCREGHTALVLVEIDKNDKIFAKQKIVILGKCIMEHFVL